MKRIAVLTSGGDAPGMNAAIRAVTRTAIDRGAEVIGVRRGYEGLMEGDTVRLTARDVGGIINLAGTVLETRRAPDFKTSDGQRRAMETLDRLRVGGVVVIGGDGSQRGANDLCGAGVPVNGVASTIDNDLCGTEMTIGVDTALNVILESIDRLRATASSHHRMFIIETMGRNCGYLALAAGIAGGAEVIVTPEHDHSPETVVEMVHEARGRGKRHVILVVAEGAKNNARVLKEAIAGGPANDFDPRITVLGHVQRGASPGAFDRLLGTRLGTKAANMLMDGKSGFLIGLTDCLATPVSLSEVAGARRSLPPELLEIARIMRL